MISWAKTRMGTIVLALTAGLIWSTNAIFIKSIQGIGVLGMSVGRMFLGAFFILIGILIFGKMKKLIRSAKHIKLWLLLGLLGAFHWGIVMVALKYTLVGNSTVLSNTTPLFLLLLGPFFLKERLKLSDIFPIALTVGGIFLMMTAKGFSFHGETFIGDVSGLLSAFLFAVYSVIVRKIHTRYPFYVMMFWMILFAGIFMTLAGWIFNVPLITGPVPTLSWVWLVLLGLFGTALGHCVYNVSLRGALRSDQVSMLTLINSPIAVLWGILFLHEILAWRGFLGMAISLMGLVWLIRTQIRRPSLLRKIQ